MDSIPAVEFVTGIAASRRVSAAVGRLARQPWLMVLPAAAAVLLVVPVVGIPVRFVRARRRGRRDRPRIGAVAVLLLAAVALTFVLGLAAVLVVGMRRHFFIPAIGLPQEWAWLLALPWLLLVLTPVAAALAHSRSFSDAGEPPAILRWSAVLGATLLLVMWAVN